MADDETDCAVGFGKPPKRTQFQKGRSGNPAGRPKGSRSFKTLLREAVREPVTVKENGRSRQISKGQASATHIANKAAMGDLRSAKFIVDQIGGLEEEEEQKITAQKNGQTSSDRINKKLDAMRAHWLKSQGLPPDDDEEPTQ